MKSHDHCQSWNIQHETINHNNFVKQRNRFEIWLATRNFSKPWIFRIIPLHSMRYLWWVLLHHERNRFRAKTKTLTNENMKIVLGIPDHRDICLKLLKSKTIFSSRHICLNKDQTPGIRSPQHNQDSFFVDLGTDSKLQCRHFHRPV